MIIVRICSLDSFLTVRPRKAMLMFCSCCGGGALLSSHAAAYTYWFFVQSRGAAGRWPLAIIGPRDADCRHSDCEFTKIIIYTDDG